MTTSSFFAWRMNFFICTNASKNSPSKKTFCCGNFLSFIASKMSLKRSSLWAWFASFFDWSTIWRRSVASMRVRSGASEAKVRRMATKVSIMRTDAATAVLEFNTDANIVTPCSVKAYGKYRTPPRFEVANCDLKGVSANAPNSFEVANCDLKLSMSSCERRNMNRAGKRATLRLTCSFRRFVVTPYSKARSLSSMTWTPRIVRIRDWISVSEAGVKGDAFSIECLPF